MVGSKINGEGAGSDSCVAQIFEIVEMSQELVLLTLDKHLLSFSLSCSMRSIMYLLGSCREPVGSGFRFGSGVAMGEFCET